MSRDLWRRLRELDAELVPRLAAALRSLLDRGRRRADVARAVTSPSGSGALRRLDDRYASAGPLALLRDVPQLGLLLVAAVFLAGAGVALARSSPDRAPQPQQVAGEQALPLELGPPVGADVDDHFATARARVLALSQDAPDDAFLALVSLVDELTPAQAAGLVAGSDLAVRRAYVRAPVGGSAEVLPVETPGEVAADLTALFSATADRRAEEQRELELLAASITAVNDSERRFKDLYVADARTKGQEAAAYRTACACVLALVVEGTARQLAELTARPSVRGLEVARRGAELTALQVDALPPEVTGVRPAPVTTVPGGG